MRLKALMTNRGNKTRGLRTGWSGIGEFRATCSARNSVLLLVQRLTTEMVIKKNTISRVRKQWRMCLGVLMSD